MHTTHALNTARKQSNHSRKHKDCTGWWRVGKGTQQLHTIFSFLNAQQQAACRVLHIDR